MMLDYWSVSHDVEVLGYICLYIYIYLYWEHINNFQIRPLLAWEASTWPRERHPWDLWNSSCAPWWSVTCNGRSNPAGSIPHHWWSVLGSQPKRNAKNVLVKNLWFSQPWSMASVAGLRLLSCCCYISNSYWSVFVSYDRFFNSPFRRLM